MLRRLLVVLAVLATTMGVAGCGSVRLEEPPAAAPTADADEQLRQQAAEDTETLLHLASAADAPDDEVAALLAAVAEDATTQLDALGGVWEPPGRPVGRLLQAGDAADVLAMLSTSAVAARDGAVTTSGDLARTLAAIAVARTVRAAQLTTATGGEVESVDPALPPTLEADSAADLIRTLDAIGWLWEAIAARSGDDERAEAAATARAWRTSAAGVAAIAGVADTPEDPRQVSYAVDTSDLPVAVATLRADLVGRWLAQLGTSTGDVRALVVDQAVAAALDAGLGAPGAEIAALPVG